MNDITLPADQLEVLQYAVQIALLHEGETLEMAEGPDLQHYTDEDRTKLALRIGQLEALHGLLPPHQGHL